jgi:hypothetical protein
VRKARTEEIRIPFGVGIAGVVAQSKEIINIKDAYQVKLNLLMCINMTYFIYSKTSNRNVYQESSWGWGQGGQRVGMTSPSSVGRFYGGASTSQSAMGLHGLLTGIFLPSPVYNLIEYILLFKTSI